MVSPQVMRALIVMREQKSAVLNRVLSRAAYSTANLKALPGEDYLVEKVLIRRIRSGMIGADPPPYTPKVLDLEKWTNEGGAHNA